MDKDPILEEVTWSRYLQCHVATLLALFLVVVVAPYALASTGVISANSLVALSGIASGLTLMRETMRIVAKTFIGPIVSSLWSERRSEQLVAILALEALFGLRFGFRPSIFEADKFDRHCSQWRRWWNSRSAIDRVMALADPSRMRHEHPDTDNES